MAEVDFAELVRSHLMPRDQSAAGRRTWDQLWAVLSSEGDLSARTYDILEDFLDTTEDALAAGALDQADIDRAKKFQQQCQHGWQRIDRDRDPGRLAWAGSAGDFQPAAQRVIATLIGAIARHRATVQASPVGPSSSDEQLWAVMKRVSLDPDDYPSSSRRA